MERNHIVQKLDYFLQNNRVPHTIFYGSAFANKEEVVMDFLKRIYKHESKLNENVILVNCAHGKGIRFIRDEIKFFAKTNVQPGISFKSVVLLNADHLTIDAQSALRRCIEQYSNHTRFFIVVEHKHKLLPPILSRFCEMYIPDPPVSLEQTQYIDTQVESIHPYVKSYIERSEKKSHLDMVETSTILYEQAFSGMDLVYWIQNRKEWTPLEKANISMYYSKIRSEFRSEKLLLLVLLSFICDCPSQNLKSLSFM